MKSRIHCITAILTIFLMLGGLTALSESVPLPGMERRPIPKRDHLLEEIAITYATSLIVRFPVADVQEFNIQGLKTWIALSGFSVIVENQPLQIAFDGDDLTLQFPITDTHAKIMGQSRVSVIDATGEPVKQVQMGETVFVAALESPSIFIAPGILFFGEYTIWVFDPLSGSITGLPADELPVGSQIYVQPTRPDGCIMTQYFDSQLQPGAYCVENSESEE